MQTFKFSYKKQNLITQILPTLIIIIGAVIAFSTIELPINKNFVFLLSSIITFLLILRIVRKASKNIEEVQILEDSHKFYFHNKAKDPLKISKSDISIDIQDDGIIFRTKEDKLIGTALKKTIEEIEDWNKLVLLLKS